MTVTLSGPPHRALADEAFGFTVSGVLPASEVGIEIRLDHAGQSWRGKFVAMADDRGSVDLQASPLRGYAEADPTTLLWALDPLLLEVDSLETEVDEPARGVVVVNAGGARVAEQTFTRVFRDEGVRCRRLDGPLAGVLYLPAGAGPHPAVITLSGSGGGVARDEAALLASRGFACLALAYFNYPGRPAELYGQPLEYFGEAIEWLAGLPEIRDDAIAVKGRSRGGELSLLLGATFPAIRAVLAVVPSGYVWGAVRKQGHQGAAWTWKQQELPRLSGSAPDSEPVFDSEGALVLAPTFRAAVAGASVESRAAAAIAAERINGPILIVCGEADALWDSVELSEITVERTASGFPFEVRRVSYADAGHNISLPHQPVLTSATHRVSGRRLAFGGTRAGTAAARAAAWREMLQFLRVAFESA